MDDLHDNKEVGKTPATVPETRMAPESVGGPGTTERRAQRIEEYLQKSLKEEDPLQAILSAGATDLMHIRLNLAESIKAELGTGQVTLEEYRKEFAPAVSSLLLLDRQIGSYTRLGQDLKRAESSAKTDPRRHGDQAERGKRA